MHVLIRELSRDGQSILGSRDTLTGGGGGGGCPFMYCLGMVRVSWDLGIL